MKDYSKNELIKIEKAIILLVNHVGQYNSNPKPLIIHSTRVGAKLMDLKIPVDIVVAGFLHDVVEDTKCTLNIIEKAFGKKAAKIVSALTQDYKFKYYKDRWHNAEQRINKIGKYGWLIKMIDARDNLPYYSRILNRKKRFYEMMWKHNLIIKNSKKHWFTLSEFNEYKRLVNKINRKWKIKF